MGRLPHAAPIINDVRSDERYAPELDEALGMTTESILAVPVIGQDHVMGVLAPDVLTKGKHHRFRHDQAAGQFEIPRAILRATCNHFHDMPADTIREHSLCCGGGGGLLTDELMDL